MPIFTLTIGFYFILLFNYSNKTLLALFFLFFFILIYFFKNIYLALFTSYLSSIPFFVGKKYSFQILSEEVMRSDLYPFGRSLTFALKVSNIFVLMMLFFVIVFLLVNIYKFFLKGKIKRKITIPKSIVVLTVFFSILLFSVFKSVYVDLSLLFYLEYASILIIYFFVLYLLNSSIKKNFNRIFLEVILAIVSLESLLSFVQFFTHGPIGLSIELQTANPLFGSGADEAYFLSRPFGTYGHANTLGMNLFIMLSVLLYYYFYIKLSLKTKKLIKLIILLGVISLILTLSRSSWLAFLVTIYFFFIRTKRVSFKLIFDTIKKFIFLLIPLFLLFAFRVIQTSNSLLSNGGLTTRIISIRESMTLFIQNPYFGTGMSTNILASYFNNPKSSVLNFPEPVHNGFILQLSESGLISFLFSFLFLIFLYNELRKKKPLLLLFSSLTVGNFMIALFLPTEILNFNLLLFIIPVYLSLI